jgi:ABC-type Fe3+ transport system permease subunit
MNRDSLLLGMLLGCIVPMFGMLLYYAVRYLPSGHSLNDFIYLLQSNHQNIPKVISLSMIACIPLITYYKNRHRYQTLKGVFILIVVYVLISVFYKFNLL